MYNKKANKLLPLGEFFKENIKKRERRKAVLKEIKTSPEKNLKFRLMPSKILHKIEPKNPINIKREK